MSKLKKTPKPDIALTHHDRSAIKRAITTAIGKGKDVHVRAHDRRYYRLDRPIDRRLARIRDLEVAAVRFCSDIDARGSLGALDARAAKAIANLLLDSTKGGPRS